MKNPALLEEMKIYLGRDEVPEDVDAFWDEEVKKVSTLPAYQLEEINFHISQVKCYELTFEGRKQARQGLCTSCSSKE
ncbi:acetyl xylan esterase [Streptococcus pneumoniae]|nr:acetyl xylan esterase [Streptococcus pneumoniae]